MAPKRCRFEGGASCFQDVMYPFVTSPSYLPPGKVDRTYMLSLKPMMAALYKCQPNLSFTKNITQKAHEHIFDARASEWGLDRSMGSKWSATMAQRLRVCCRFMAQARVRVPPPGWVANMGLGDAAYKGKVECQGENKDEGKGEEEEEEEEEREDEETASTDADDWVYGYDSELRQVWRSNAAATSREYAVFLSAEKGAAPTDAPVARFRDGSTYAVAELTNADIHARPRSSKAVATPSPLGLADGRPVKIQFRNDRNRLCIIFVEGLQKMQVRVDAFPTEDACRAFMQGIVQDLVENKFTVDDLYQERDKRMTALGIRLPMTSKRPASAEGGRVKKKLEALMEENRRPPGASSDGASRERGLPSASDVDMAPPSPGLFA